MKGQMLWTLIQVVIAVVIFVTGVQVIFFGIQSKVEYDQRQRSHEIAGIINTMQNGPDGSLYTYTLPRIKCSVSIDKNYVYVTTAADKPDDASFGCSDDSETTVEFRKEGSRLVIKKMEAG